LSKSTGTVKTFMNPAGFIEVHYIGRQTAESVAESVKVLQKSAKKIHASKRPVLILLDISRLKIVFDQKAHAVAARGLTEVPFERGAIYGPLKAQLLINTLSMVAGVQYKVRAFGDRLEAIEWLRGKV